MEFSEKITKISMSSTLEITQLAKLMQQKGKNIISLAAGEPDFKTSLNIKNAAIQAIKNNFTNYTATSGILSLRKAICEKLRKDNNLVYSPEEILVSNGAKHVLYNICQVILNKNDEVIIISPYWVSYPEIIKLTGAKPVIIKTSFKNNFKVDPKQIRSAITPLTKAIIVNSPSNPVGIVYSKEELEEIGKICFKNNILILSDEIYEKLIYDGKKHYSIASISQKIKNLTITINGVSKAFAMTGWRIGYAAGNKIIIKKATILQSHSTANPCSVSQIAAEAALKEKNNDMLKKFLNELNERRLYLTNYLSNEIGLEIVVPQGAFYIFCSIKSSGLSSINFCKKLLQTQGVAIIPGKPFGENNFIRISLTQDLSNIKKAAQRIKKFINNIS